jgi:hypothetical protein
MLGVTCTTTRMHKRAQTSTTGVRATRIVERAERNILNRLVEAVVHDCWHRNNRIA